MGRAALSIVMLTACGSDGLLEVRVLPPANGTRVDEVELYIGVHDEHDGSVRPALGQLAPTVWWKRHPRVPEFEVQPMSADGAMYQFAPGGVDGGISALVAVGFVTTDLGKVPAAVATQLAWLDIPDDEVHRYELTLGDFDRLPRDQSDRPGVPGLQIWGPTKESRDCVQVDDVPELAEYTGAQSAMIVTKDDHDCDSFPDGDRTVECLDDEFNGGQPMTRDSLSCILDRFYADATGQTDICVVGGQTCADGVPANGCSPSNYCTPTGVCSSGCLDLSCDPSPGSVPHILRMMPASSSGTNKSFCAGAHAFLDLQHVLPGLACDPVKKTKLRTVDLPFAETLVFGADAATRMTIGLATDDVTKCWFNVMADGPLSSSGQDQTNYRVALAAPLVGAMNHGLVVPILVQAVDNQCATNEGTCTYSGAMTSDLGLLACMKAPVLPQQIVID